VISGSVSGCSTGLLRVLSGSAPSGFNPDCFFGDMSDQLLSLVVSKTKTSLL
jgi:hypothetical protein